MKKFFAILGIIFVIVIVLGAVGIGFIAGARMRWTKESRAYADAAIPAIVSGAQGRRLIARVRSSKKLSHSSSSTKCFGS